MPEFEDSKPKANPDHNYTPSTDAKPRTRRRSGGFKKEYADTPNGPMGEIDPLNALPAENLSGRAEAFESSKEKAPSPRERKEPRAESVSTSVPQPSEETLAAIRVVEGRIAERKARYEARKKKREAERPTGRFTQRQRRNGHKNIRKKKGFLASILGFFGLGSKKSSGKTRSGRPQGNGRGGQRRRPHRNRRPQAHRR